MGAHTAKSNLVRLPAAHRSRKRRGGRAAGSGYASSHPPALPCAGRGRGVTNPLRRGTAAAGRGASPIVPPPSSGQTPTASSIGCARHTRGRQLPTPGRKPGSRQETPHPRTGENAGTGGAGNGETRGVRGVGWVVGVGVRRACRPGSRRGRKAPGRLPGRPARRAPAPPRLTSCRWCGKMLHEGSHRRRSQRRPSSMVRQKPGRFRNDRALLYLGHHPRDYRRIKCA